MEISLKLVFLSGIKQLRFKVSIGHLMEQHFIPLNKHSEVFICSSKWSESVTETC